MKSVNIYINNIKCSGCADNIEQTLTAIDGVKSAKVNIEKGSVEVLYEGGDRRPDYVGMLAKLGYPEKEASSFMSDHIIREL